MFHRHTLMTTLAALALVSAAPAAWASEETARITVTGEGSVSAAPDMAIINFGVLKSAATARQALDDANKALAEAIADLKAKGIEARDLQTSGFSVSPQFDYSAKNGTAPKLTGYQVSNMLTVRVRDIASLGKVLDDAVTNGINSGGSLSFGNSKQKDLVADARKAAVADAITKAKALTEAAGVSTGDILNIAEETSMAPPVPMVRMAMAKEATDSVPVEAGESDYHARVTVTFAINQKKP
ncbi:SIMPL domain-containing protein [Rhizobium sp. C4]|uniref:SIMPL domain-containing protein n=1 Tax=Rhizobium sp. C4 TaxID=1349800 RepID=UPI001E2F5EDE|nr:SIMPL domain-containing protein [Rhizobium sp. C4]MCD2175920.1 SIMPL domain-containing protein [Rhizobium sp. C4]